MNSLDKLCNWLYEHHYQEYYDLITFELPSQMDILVEKEIKAQIKDDVITGHWKDFICR